MSARDELHRAGGQDIRVGTAFPAQDGRLAIAVPAFPEYLERELEQLRRVATR
jgi:hypothetical protein